MAGRGRPRQFDETAAVAAAGELFWMNGFSATSLDDLAGEMGMNRPSIYRAFGDKESLYRLALARFCEGMSRAMADTLFSDASLARGLKRFYREALNIYCEGTVPKGCMVMGTAVVAATCHPEIRQDLSLTIREIDARLEERMRAAVEAGELRTDFEVKDRAALAQGLLHTLSIRSRAGESRARLNRLVASGVSMLLA